MCGSSLRQVFLGVLGDERATLPLVLSIALPAFIFVVWLLWIPVCILGKEARGEVGGVSILPGVPLFPLAAWGLAALLNLIHDRLGLILVGGFHVLLFLAFLGSLVHSSRVLRRSDAEPGAKS